MTQVQVQTRYIPRVTFLGVLRSQWCQTMSLRSTYVLHILNIIFIAGGSAIVSGSYLLMSSISDDSMRGYSNTMYWYAVGAAVSTCAIIVGIYGVMSITTEFTSSSIEMSLCAVPKRMEMYTGKALVTFAISFVSSLIGLLMSWAITSLIFSGTHVEPLASNEQFIPWVVILGGAVILAVISVMAMGIGAICRSTVGGILTLVGVLMIVPSILEFGALGGKKFEWTQTLNNVLPAYSCDNFMAAGRKLITNMSLSDMMETSGGIFTPTWWQSGLILLGWSVLMYIIGMIVLDRVDI